MPNSRILEYDSRAWNIKAAHSDMETATWNIAPSDVKDSESRKISSTTTSRKLNSLRTL
jgi:hypothetical protein